MKHINYTLLTYDNTCDNIYYPTYFCGTKFGDRFWHDIIWELLVLDDVV